MLVARGSPCKVLSDAPHDGAEPICPSATFMAHVGHRKTRWDEIWTSVAHTPQVADESLMGPSI